MPISQLVVVADAHLGAVPPALEDGLLALLDAVPKLGDGLLVNGDLFGFWFGFRRAVPREGLRVLSRLAALARRLPVLLTGGNHDRWGEPCARELGLEFARGELRFSLGGSSVIALHGDGFCEPTAWLRLKHRIVGHPLIAAGYRALPADLGFWLMSRPGGDLARDERALRREAESARLQLAWAEQTLRDAPADTLLIMGHTHRAVARELAPGKRYLNPGAWLDGQRYAIATERELRLTQYPG